MKEPYRSSSSSMQMVSQRAYRRKMRHLPFVQHSALFNSWNCDDELLRRKGLLRPGKSHSQEGAAHGRPLGSRNFRSHRPTEISGSASEPQARRSQIRQRDSTLRLVSAAQVL